METRCHEEKKVAEDLRSSAIADYLPSTIIDELDMNNTKQNFPSSNIFLFKEGKQSNPTRNSSETTMNTIGNMSSPIRKVPVKKIRSEVTLLGKRNKPLQKAQYSGSHANIIPKLGYSDNIKGFYKTSNNNMNQQQQNLFIQFPMMIPTQSPQTHQMNFFQNYQSNLSPKKSSILESQIESLNGIMSLKMIIDTYSSETILNLIKSSKGSRHLQKIISSVPPSQYEVDRLVTIIAPVATEMMCDYYGNYFLQKFIPHFSLKHRLTFYQFIESNFLQIANNICGNHSLQSLISLQNSKEEESIIKSSIENYLPTMAFGANSSHVIAKVITSVKESNRSYINCYVINNLIQLSLDSNGICIVKAFIAGLKHESYIGSVIFQFSAKVSKLTYDQYGNFAIQEVINRFGLCYANNIIFQIVQYLVPFSISKFSSNVVDCIIKYFSKNSIENFIQIVIKIFFEENNLNELLKNKYATFVIENCLNLIFEMKNPELNELKSKLFSLLMNKREINSKVQIMKILKKFFSTNP